MRASRVFALAVALLAAVFGSVAPAYADPRIGIFDFEKVTPGTGVAFGQIVAAPHRCTQGREFRLIAKDGNGASEVLDRGRASREGSISALLFERELLGAKNVIFKAKAVEACPSLVASLSDRLVTDRSARSPTVKTKIVFVDIDGIGNNGAVAGIVMLNKQGNCFKDRRVSLAGNGTLLDRGQTTAHGAWSLRITRGEFESLATITVTVAGLRADSGDHCSGAKKTVAIDSL